MNGKRGLRHLRYKTEIQRLLAEKERRKSVSGSRGEALWLFLVYIVPYVIIAAIALFWPAHSGPFGLDFTTSPLATSVPSIAAYIEKSPFPHATAAYYVISAFVFLPYIIGGVIYPLGFWCLGSRARMTEWIAKNRKWEVWRRMGAVPFSFVMIFIAWGQPGLDFSILPVAEERWALALGGVIFSFYCVLYIYVGVLTMALKITLEQLMGRGLNS